MRAAAWAFLLLLAAQGTAAARAADPQVEIDRVEVTGVSVFERGPVEAALELTAGDRLERLKVVRTVDNLQELYRIHGYEEAAVRGELIRTKVEDGTLEHVLRFQVVEGLPTRIASVGPVRLAGKTAIAVGEVLDEEKLSAARRAIQDALASEEFIGARVDEVRIETATAPPEAAGMSAARWVAVEFRADLGDRVTFGFRGNSAFTRSRLLGLVEDQRVLGFGKDYVGAIRSRIEDEYRAIGHARVAVTPLTFERPERQERHVTYVIQEGPRIVIESVDFDGNLVFTDERLRGELFARAGFLVQRRIYVEKEVEKAAEILVEWLKSQGYLAAKLVTVNRAYDDKGRRIRLVVYLYEGDQTLVQGIRLVGLKAMAEAEAVGLLGVREGEPLNLFAFNEGIEALKAAYRARGFLDARIKNESSDTVVLYSQENRAADVLIDLDEGPQYRVSRVEVEGLSGTRESVVLRELVFGPDDVLEEALVTESEARLRKLGIFSVVTIRAVDDPARRDRKIVKVSVQEGTPGVIAGGVGYRNDLGARAFGQIAYTNLWRRNHTVSLSGNVNRRIQEEFCVKDWEQALNPSLTRTCFVEYQFQLGYVWPWFALGQTTFRPRITLDRTQYRNFDASSIAFAGTFERRVLRSTNLSASLTYTLERTEQFNAEAPEDNERLTIGSLTPGLRLDLRDNSLAPTSGFFSSASYEVASTALLSQSEPFPVGFTRFQYRADGFVPIAREISWYLSFRMGFERNTEPPPASDPNNKRYAIPLSKQFALGGAGSLRGFSEQELNVQDLAIRGTLSYVNYRTQLDVPFAGPMRFGPFLDAANLLVDRFSFGILRFGAGVGFHYQSPVGPVNFDLGFKINPRAGEDPYRFYFSIGVI